MQGTLPNGGFSPAPAEWGAGEDTLAAQNPHRGFAAGAVQRSDGASIVPAAGSSPGAV